MGIREIVVPVERAGDRADQVLGKALGLSRAKVKQLFDQRKVKLGKRALKKGDALEAGQHLQVSIDEALPALVPEPAAPLSILYSDDTFVFIDKPSGVPSHPLLPGETGTVANALIGRFRECANVSVDPREGGLCHRLDVETSGVLLAARTSEAWKAARRSFQNRKVEKYYLALVEGPIADKGEVAIPLRHDPKHPDRVEAVIDDPKARQAQTLFRVVERSGAYSLVEARIITGVLHQVRAHFAAIGAPLVGDLLYGGRPFPGLTRFFLHAVRLSIPHPVTGQMMSASSPLPSDLIHTLQTTGFAGPLF